MKRICLAICLCLSIMMSWAQVDSRYDKGSVTVVNGRVLFQETIPTTLDQAVAFERIGQWAKQRFSKPNVIISKVTSNDATNHSLSLTAEEYIVFTDRFFVLDRTRINYWYEEEREGGLKFSAEEFITDENAFNKKGKLLKEQGKFRKGTIDFFDRCVTEMTKVLND